MSEWPKTNKIIGVRSYQGMGMTYLLSFKDIELLVENDKEQ